MTPTHTIYVAAGCPAMEGEQEGVCRLCGRADKGALFGTWVKDTFTDWDKLHPGTLICHACQYCTAEADEVLTRRVGSWWADEQSALLANPDRVEAWRKRHKKAPDDMPHASEIGIKFQWGGWCIPQKMRNYSHFVLQGVWHPLSKGNKAEMRRLLFASPSVAVIAESGQKHLLPFARLGWWTFELATARPFPDELGSLLALVELLYQSGITKAEIETGRYSHARILALGLDTWRRAEASLTGKRGSLPLALALFLAQREDVC